MKDLLPKNMVRHQIPREKSQSLPFAACQSNIQDDTEHLRIKKALGEHLSSGEFGWGLLWEDGQPGKQQQANKKGYLLEAEMHSRLPESKHTIHN